MEQLLIAADPNHLSRAPMPDPLAEDDAYFEELERRRVAELDEDEQRRYRDRKEELAELDDHVSWLNEHGTCDEYFDAVDERRRERAKFEDELEAGRFHPTPVPPPRPVETLHAPSDLRIAGVVVSAAGETLDREELARRMTRVFDAAAPAALQQSVRRLAERTYLPPDASEQERFWADAWARGAVETSAAYEQGDDPLLDIARRTIAHELVRRAGQRAVSNCGYVMENVLEEHADLQAAWESAQAESTRRREESRRTHQRVASEWLTAVGWRVRQERLEPAPRDLELWGVRIARQGEIVSLAELQRRLERAMTGWGRTKRSSGN